MLRDVAPRDRAGAEATYQHSATTALDDDKRSRHDSENNAAEDVGHASIGLWESFQMKWDGVSYDS